jgi:phosphoribosylformylglycinamidine cyclo-ligase
MLRTFNMGVGLIVVVGAGDAGAVLQALGTAGEHAITIGTVRSGRGGVVYQ